MTDNCEFCHGAGKEPGLDGCVWCHNTGKKAGQKLFAAPTDAALADAIKHGVGVMVVSPEGAQHVPLKDTLVNLKPFKSLPYGTRFRYQGIASVFVRTQHNVVADWPCRLFGADGVPRQSLYCFCHEDGDEDGNTLDTLVEVVDPDAELAALREELAQSRILAADQGLNLKRVKREYVTMKERATAAEQRNAELVELLNEVLSEVPHGWGESFNESELAERIRSVTESGASE